MVGELCLDVGVGDVFHVAAIERNTETKDSVTLRGNFIDLGNHLLLFAVRSKLVRASVVQTNAVASVKDAFWCTLQQDTVARGAWIVLDHC